VRRGGGVDFVVATRQGQRRRKGKIQAKTVNNGGGHGSNDWGGRAAEEKRGSKDEDPVCGGGIGW